MRALVTGSAGFVGRHFARHLTQEGHDVTGIDIADPACPLDCRTFFRYTSDYFDLVVHCAAVVGGRETIDRSPMAVADNLSIDVEMFRWALRTRPGRVVYFSSSAAYPTCLQNGPPYRMTEGDIDLDLPHKPDAIYGWTKLTGELLARHAQAEGVPVSIFRPFSGYGEDQSLDYPFPSFAKRARDHEDPFEIWGDGLQVRDWIHVSDIVGAVMAALHFEIRGPVNLGWGEPVSMGELVMMFCELANYDPEVRLNTDAPTGVRYRCANADRMLSFYAPRITIEEGIARALATERVPVT